MALPPEGGTEEGSGPGCDRVGAMAEEINVAIHDARASLTTPTHFEEPLFTSGSASAVTETCVEGSAATDSTRPSPSAMEPSRACAPAGQHVQAQGETLSSGPTGKYKDRTNSCSCIGNVAGGASSESTGDSSGPVSDSVIDAAVERVCLHLCQVLTGVMHEALAAGMAPLEKTVGELRAVSQHLFAATLRDSAQRQQRNQPDHARRMQRDPPDHVEHDQQHRSDSAHEALQGQSEPGKRTSCFRFRRLGLPAPARDLAQHMQNSQVESVEHKQHPDRSLETLQPQSELAGGASCSQVEDFQLVIPVLDQGAHSVQTPQSQPDSARHKPQCRSEPTRGASCSQVKHLQLPIPAVRRPQHMQRDQGGPAERQSHSQLGRAQQKPQYQSEPAVGTPSPQEGLLRLPIPAKRRLAPRSTSSSAASDANSHACASQNSSPRRVPADPSRKFPSKTDQQSTFRSEVSVSSMFPRLVNVADGSLRKIRQRFGRRGLSRVTADPEAASGVVPSEASGDQKPPSQGAGNEHSQTPRGMSSGQPTFCEPGRQTFGHRRAMVDDLHCVQSLLLGVADQILLDNGLMKFKENSNAIRAPPSDVSSVSVQAKKKENPSAIRDPTKSATNDSRLVPEVPDDGHAQPPKASQEPEETEHAQVGASENPVDGRHSRDSPGSNNANPDSGSEKGSAGSLFSPVSPASPRRLRQTRVEEFVQSVNAAAQYVSCSGPHLTTDRRLCYAMKACGVLPWTDVEESDTFWRHPGVWYQWLILVMVFVACGVCLWTLWTDMGATNQWLDRDASPRGSGLAMDVPLTAGVCIGLLFMRAFSGSKELNECHLVLRSYSSRATCFNRWMRHAQGDFICSSVVGTVAVVLRLVGESFTVHSVACAFASAVLSSLTFSMMYVCRGSSNMVDQYCMYAMRITPTDQLIYDWNVVQAVLRKASGALEKCIFALQTAALGAVVLGLIDVVRGAVTGFAQYACFISWALVTVDFARVLFCAAAVTERCARVPSLMSTSCNDMDPNRQYVVQHVIHARAGFYVFEVLLDSALAMKVAYTTCAVGFVVATQFALHF